MFKSGFFSFNIFRLFDAVRLARKTFGGYKKQIAILTTLGFLGGLLEAIGVNALIPLFSFFVESTDRLGTDFVALFIQKAFSFLHIPFTLPFLLVFICALFVLKGVTTIYFNYMRMSIRTKYERNMMDTLYRETLSTDWPYLSKQKVGHLETVIMTDVRQSAGLLENIARTIGVVSEFFMYLIIALNISESVTVMTLVVGMIIFFVFKPLLYKARKLGKETEQLNKEVSHHVNQSIGGIKNIKAMGNEGAFAEVGSFYFKKLRSVQMRSFMIQNYTMSLIQPIGVIFIVMVVAFAYYQTSYNLGALAAIIYLIQKMFAHVQSLQSFAQMISGAVPYVQGMLEYQDQAAQFKEQKKGSGLTPFSFQRNLSFDNISFSYEENEQLLKGISLEIKKGEMVGFIGKSGSGKTTLFDLFLRLLTPTSGTIAIDGVDLQKIDLAEWRSRIAYVPQDPFLLNDTIYNNIVFYNPNVTREDVEMAVKFAHIHEFIEELPQGYETVVGERGVRLSGGQRQRIAIARALARRPEILLLDEATSALDVESETFIQQALEDLKGKMTVLIIAHRLSTIAHSDMLIVLEKGKIRESGKPKELIKEKETYYAKMYNVQI